MPIGVFTEKTHSPSEAEIAAALGGALPLWLKTTDHLGETCSRPPEMKFYGKNYGWALRYRLGGKALASLYPGKGAFSFQIIMSDEAITRIRPGAIRPKTRQLIQQATPFREGRWIFLTIHSPADQAEAFACLDAKLQSFKPPPQASRTASD